MHIEILNTLARDGNLLLEYILYDRVTDAVTALENGEVRIVLGALPGDVANHIGVTFTNGLSSSSMCMIVPAGQTEKVIYRGDTPRPYRLGFELGSVSLNQISRLPSATMVPVGSQQQLYRQLTSGQSDAVVCAKESMLYMLERAGIRSEYSVAVSQITEIDYMLLMREDDRLLHNRLNEYIGDLRASNQYNNFLSKWLIDLDKQDMQAQFRLLLWSIAILAVIAGSIIFTFYYMNARLKVLVAEKTSELNRKVVQLEEASNL
jgi:ABC-type amino acid transport substrate-binding protein